jgi:hypothetical protein
VGTGPQAREELRLLAQAYHEALALADTTRRRVVLRPMLVHHARRSVDELERQAHADAAAADDPGQASADLTALEHCRKGLPVLPSKRLAAGYLLTTFFLAYAMANWLFGWAEQAQLLGDGTKAVSKLDASAFFDAFRTPKGSTTSEAERISSAGLLLIYATLVTIALPAWAYGVKRKLLWIDPRSREQLDAASPATCAPAEGSILSRERAAFRSYSATPPAEWYFDLWARMLLLIPIAYTLVIIAIPILGALTVVDVFVLGGIGVALTATIGFVVWERAHRRHPHAPLAGRHRRLRAAAVYVSGSLLWWALSLNATLFYGVVEYNLYRL